MRTAIVFGRESCVDLVLAEMACTGRQWCDFVSDPRLPGKTVNAIPAGTRFESTLFLKRIAQAHSCGISAESDTSDRNVKETELDCTYAQPSQHHRQAVGPIDSKSISRSVFCPRC